MTTIHELRLEMLEIESKITKIMNEQVAPLLSDFTDKFELDNFQLVAEPMDDEDDHVTFEVRLHVGI